MSLTEATTATLSSTPNRRSYRCYNCNDAFHITTTTNTTAVSSSSSSFRCPRCFHRHLLPNYTIATPITTPPSPQSEPSINPNFTPSATNSFVFYESESDTEWTDSDDIEFEFNSTEFSSPTLKSFIDLLPTVKIKEPLKSCSICLEELEVNKEVSELPCNHFFHKHCIVPWLKKNNTCPLCRYELPREEVDEFEKDSEEFLASAGLISELSEFDYEEFLVNGVVFVSTTTPPAFVPSSSEVGEDDDEVNESVPEEMRDEDGDMLMVDA
ncbi:E3 ubiquitin-protein ligase RDUF2-like [Lycium barbarum]|uniref:E3 ubiquitin-protein ligase RDUF2-like n=1 Tax=Lycium barbarum TaxID=112863 RepID=UPI00293ED18D|nr:E3 ubiquitin-protein ligase RDUF2-like [Lycium barbarum]